MRLGHERQRGVPIDGDGLAALEAAIFLEHGCWACRRWGMGALGGGARAEGGRGYIPPAQRLMTPPLSIAQTSNLRSPPRFGDETPATPNQTKPATPTFLTAHTSSHRQISLSDLLPAAAGRPRSHARLRDSLRRCAHKGHARRPTGLIQALSLDETVPFRRVIALDTVTRFISLSAATLSVVRTRHLRPTTPTRP